MLKIPKFVSIILISNLLLIPFGFSCTVFFEQGSPSAVVAKNFDYFSGQGVIYINKRHVRKQAILIGGQNPLKWSSKYMSLTLTQSGLEFPFEGMNEMGLSVNSLRLLPTQNPPTVDSKPGIEMLQWIQYILDTSSTVDEAISNAGKVRVAVLSTLHYFVCDQQGSCASFENIDGQLHIQKTNTDRPYSALANSSYANSLSYLEVNRGQVNGLAILSNPSMRSLDRFSRAALFSVQVPSKVDEIEYAFSSLKNLSQVLPTEQTYWSMAFALKTNTVYLKTFKSPQLKSVQLSKFDPSCRSGTQMLDLNSLQVGDVATNFVSYTESANQALIEANPQLSSAIKKSMENYPSQFTTCEE